MLVVKSFVSAYLWVSLQFMFHKSWTQIFLKVSIKIVVISEVENDSDTFQLDNRLFYVQTLLKWELFDKRERALEQIKEGLNTFKFLDRIGHLQEFEQLYLCRDKRTTSAEFVREKLIPEVKKLTPEAKDEEKAKTFTLKCLDMLEGNQILEQKNILKIIHHLNTFF